MKFRLVIAGVSALSRPAIPSLHLRYIDEKLAEAEARAEDLDAKWFDHNEFWNKVMSL